ncbi:MAG: hypothetical protein ACRBG0_27350 [Lewinella sp.]|uniref:hypothetical protein n=1 Tax=Lewinella sp. TaxID=2004506 RepID=UPI003D6A9C7C
MSFSIQEYITKSKAHLLKDELFDALKVLIVIVGKVIEQSGSSTSKELQNQLYLFSNNLNRIKKDYLLGVIDWDKKNTELNKLVLAILNSYDLLQELNEELENNEGLSLTIGSRIYTHRLRNINREIS